MSSQQIVYRDDGEYVEERDEEDKDEEEKDEEEKEEEDEEQGGGEEVEEVEGDDD